MQLRILKNEKHNDLYNLTVVTNEIINLNNFLPKKLTAEKVQISLNVEELQFIEPQTVIGEISLLPEQNFSITKIKKALKTSNRLMLVNKKNYETYYSERNNFLVKKNDMVKAGDRITPGIKINSSGQILTLKPYKCTLHKGIPLFLTNETVLYKEKDDLVKFGDKIGTIIYEQVITGDIVHRWPMAFRRLCLRCC